MKMKKSVFALLLVAVILASFTAGAAASGNLSTISAYLDAGASVKLNGVTQSFTDANGNRVYLINYNGTNYLPVRAMAGLFNLSVDWDQTTRTIILGKSLTGSNLIDEIGSYFRTNVNNYNKATEVKTEGSKTYNFSGFDCTSYVQLHMYRENWACDMGSKCRASYNLKGQYETVTFKCYSAYGTTLRVLTDNDAVQKEIVIEGGEVAQEYTVPLYKTAQLTFEAEKTQTDKDTDVYIFDVTVK